MNLKNELLLAQKLAREAGHIALLRQSSLTINHKPLGQGPVSDADIFIDDYLCERIAQNFPDDQIISEEGYRGEAMRAKGRVWFIDPIDGTASYVVGRSDFVVMIGLLIEHVPVLGVIYQPSSDTMWSGISEGSQHWCEKREGNECVPIAIKKQKRDYSQLRLIISRSSKSKRQSQLIAEINPLSVVHQSSIGLKAMLVMEGKADFYVCWNRHMKMWDTAAPYAIIQASGALMSHLDGVPLSYEEGIAHSQPIMVANFEPDGDFMALLKNLVDG